MTKIPVPTSSAKLDLFLDRLATRQSSTGRLIFSLDATMSREATWARAIKLQAEMFSEAAAVGGLEIQLVYYRGRDECTPSCWTTDAHQLGEIMARIECASGETQLAKILAHARREHDKAPIGTLVFVGDAIEESVDTLYVHADELGFRNVRALMFQEGDNPEVEKAFREIARRSRGAYCRFSAESAHELRELLRAAAAYAAGGLRALSNLKAQQAVKLLEQLK